MSPDMFQSELIDLLPRLRRFARALTRQAADADDLVQAAVERALARRGAWRPGTRLDAWVFTIMKNVWIDEVRARRRRASAAPQAVAEAAPDPLTPSLEQRLEAGAVRRAIAELPDDQRLAVALVLVEGLSYAEAAVVAGVPQGTLTSRLGRGRAALMARLAGADL